MPNDPWKIAIILAHNRPRPLFKILSPWIFKFQLTLNEVSQKDSTTKKNHFRLLWALKNAYQIRIFFFKRLWPQIPQIKDFGFFFCFVFFTRWTKLFDKIVKFGNLQLRYQKAKILPDSYRQCLLRYSNPRSADDAIALHDQ